jgi:hypothetical protein
MARHRVADRGYGLQIWRVAANTLNKQSRTADSGWSSSLGVGLTTLPRKTHYLLRITTHSLGTGRITWHNLKPLGRPRRRWVDGIKMDLREIGLRGVDWIRLS